MKGALFTYEGKGQKLLCNIAYRRISKEDFDKTNFIINVFTYLVLDLKPFFLHATYSEEEDREMIKMLWGQYVPKAFFNFIKQPDNFEYLLSQNVLFKESMLLSKTLPVREIIGLDSKIVFQFIIRRISMFTSCFFPSITQRIISLG